MTKSPVQTRTRTITETVIVPGDYGPVTIGHHQTPGRVDIRWGALGTTTDELKAYRIAD